MHCEQCGGEVDDRQPYCGHCGAQFEPPEGVKNWYAAGDAQPDQVDPTVLYEQVADRDYLTHGHAARGQGYSDVGPPAAGEYADPLPPRPERGHRGNVVAIVAGAVIIAGLVTAAVIVLNGRSPSATATDVGVTTSVATTTASTGTPTSSSAQTSTTTEVPSPTDVASNPLPDGAATTGWTDSQNLQCTGGQSALLLLQTASAKVTICGNADGTKTSYHGLTRSAGDTIVLSATADGESWVAFSGTTEYSVTAAGLTIIDSSGAYLLDEPAELTWTPT